jgi:hypothetical protein
LNYGFGRCDGHASMSRVDSPRAYISTASASNSSVRPRMISRSLQGEHVHALRSRERVCFLVVQTLWGLRLFHQHYRAPPAAPPAYSAAPSADYGPGYGPGYAAGYGPQWGPPVTHAGGPPRQCPHQSCPGAGAKPPHGALASRHGGTGHRVRGDGGDLLLSHPQQRSRYLCRQTDAAVMSGGSRLRSMSFWFGATMIRGPRSVTGSTLCCGGGPLTSTGPFSWDAARAILPAPTFCFPPLWRFGHEQLDEGFYGREDHPAWTGQAHG